MCVVRHARNGAPAMKAACKCKYGAAVVDARRYAVFEWCRWGKKNKIMRLSNLQPTRRDARVYYLCHEPCRALTVY